MNVKNLYLLMFLHMVLWLILQRGAWMEPERTVGNSSSAVGFSFQPSPLYLEDKEAERNGLGIALGGGGFKGFCHLGVLEALDESGIHPDRLAGVSAGALIAALYADGYSSDSILAMYNKLNFMDYVRLDFQSGGLLSLDGFREYLDTLLHASTFEELKIPLRVVVTDLDQGRSVVFDRGNLVDALIASCSVPVLFKPSVINGVNYVDGGILHNLPAFALRNDCQIVMGVSLGPIQTDPYEKSMLTVALRSYRYIFRSNANYDKSLCDVLIEPPGIGAYDGADVNQVLAIYKLGYDATRQMLDSLEMGRPALFKRLKR